MTAKNVLPLVPIKNTFVFPNTVQKIPIHLISKNILQDEYFSEHDEAIVVLSKRPVSEIDRLTIEDIQTVGVRVELIQRLDLPGEEIRVVVEGLHRVLIQKIEIDDSGIMATYEPFPTQGVEDERVAQHVQNLFELFKTHMNVLGDEVPGTLLSVLELSSPEEMADMIGSYLTILPSQKQQILSEPSISERLKLVRQFLNEKVIEAQLDQSIDTAVDTKIDSERREALLRAKLRAIQHELNEADQNEIQIYQQQIEKCQLSEDVRHEIEKEIRKLERCNQDSSEAASIRNYLDFVLELPWSVPMLDEINLENVKKILNSQHYGLEDVKKRILEYLAVRQLSKTPTSNILCLAGPPGVGKTSIVKAVAKAMGRPFYRVALGGIRDEADIRGHRRSYVGALPGRIVSAISKANSFSPVILLDEIDKMSSGFRGDPAAVLLELLDPEQNDAFVDHFLQIPIDLSHVLFICTANDLAEIPTPLLNRLETIKITGYGLKEKMALCQRYLIPEQLKNNGLADEKLKFPKDVIHYIITHYTNDVGLRSLNRCFESICRKLALKKVQGKPIRKEISKHFVKETLGSDIPKPSFSKKAIPGRSTALFSIGMVGDVMPIEAIVYPGVGQMMATGNIDPLLKETVITCVSYLKGHYEEFGIDSHYFNTHDSHIHFHKPELVKKGEGWGLAIFASLLSSILQIPLPPTLAFAGQLSLLGKVLPTGDIEQKLLAASQLGIEKVMISHWNLENKKIFIPPEIEVITLEDLVDLKDLLLDITK